MEVWHIWVIAALLLFIIEIFTSGFAVICIAVGALGGAVAALCNAPLWGQLLAFAILSFVSLFTVRPVMLRYFSKGSRPSNMDSLIGREVRVSVPVGKDSPGMVKVYGDEWQIVSDDGNEIPAGATVRITGQDSNILTVHRLD
ncbi:MAG: NfeD family protein [Bacteroidetes bacterium]|uniref:NfeD family protein n=1 Tax=Candidatus Cryptobacteroides intestinavium TaxID=2840766 RepID=A0A9D9ESJ1_9BACT|nr:NfeD family protein [Candidatus Cryptobacteroides intestinavium]